MSTGDVTPLRFEEVRKEFRSVLPRRTVVGLERLSFRLRAGEIVGLVGPNGSGKTTTFRLAAGLLRPSRGTVAVMGLAPGSSRARRLQGYMPEQPGVPDTLTPAELLHFVGRTFGMSRAQRTRRVDELSELLALGGFLRRRMGGFSKGMIKRVGLATALFNEPPLLLLDEPLEGVDPIGAALVKDYLLELARKQSAILISSHILSDVEALCSSLVILNEGRMILSGSKDDILALHDMVVLRFSAPNEEELLEAIEQLIAEREGTVYSTGRPRKNLEDVFKRLLGPGAGREPEL